MFEAPPIRDSACTLWRVIDRRKGWQLRRRIPACLVLPWRVQAREALSTSMIIHVCRLPDAIVCRVGVQEGPLFFSAVHPIDAARLATNWLHLRCKTALLFGRQRIKKPPQVFAGARDPRERRARDSNPQPVARHLISSQAANHSHTLRGRSRLLPNLMATATCFKDACHSHPSRIKAEAAAFFASVR